MVESRRKRKSGVVKRKEQKKPGDQTNREKLSMIQLRKGNQEEAA